MRRLETFLIAVAAVFYVWFASHFGIDNLWKYVAKAGWGLALTVALETIARIANTIGWRVTIADYPRSLSFAELFFARIGGEAIDYVTPSAQLGGQFVMALTVRDKLRMPLGLATVTVAALAEMLGQIAFIVGAFAISLSLIPAAGALRWSIVGGFAIALALAAGFYFVQRRRPFEHLRGVAARLNLHASESEEIRASAGEADAALNEFYGRHRGRFAASVACYAFAWSCGPAEIWILMRLLGNPCSVGIAVLVEALGLLIERATFLIPAKLVSQEGGKALVLSTLGYTASAGFAIGFLRRVKEMIWVLFGLVALMIHRIAESSAPPVHDGAATGAPVKIQSVQGEHSI
jgi:uncharacterized membrane protein YbhN (UPF0104 family)